MMNTIIPIRNNIPLMVPLTPTTDHKMENNDHSVLDLCTRKRTTTPEYHTTPEYRTTPEYCTTPKHHQEPPPSAGSPHSEISDSSEISSTDLNSNCTSRMKPIRPFKAYPKDPTALPLLVSTTDVLKDSSEAYIEFRNRMLAQVQNNQSTNKNMRRIQNSRQISDPTYWEKRKKNNEAAKRSRDARKAKEDEIAIRCAFLEQENIQLKYRLAALEAESKKLYDMIYR